MAADTLQPTGVLPSVYVEPDVLTKLGLSVELDTTDISRRATGLKMADVAIQSTKITLSAEMEEDEVDGKPRLVYGSCDDEGEIKINMGSIALAVERKLKTHSTIKYAQELIGFITSYTIAHELKHAADLAVKGKDKLEREERRFEFRRLTGAILPKLGGIAIGVAALAGIEGLTLLIGFPRFMNILGGIGGLALLGEATGELVGIHRKTKSTPYHMQEKSYGRHPQEKRAFRYERRYRRDYVRDRAQLLAVVKIVSEEPEA